MPVLLKTFVRKSIFNEVRDFIHHNHNGKDVIDTKPNIKAIKLSIIVIEMYYNSFVYTVR